MKRFVYIIVLSLLPLLGYSQEQFVINNGYVVLANGTAGTPTYLVIHNGANSGIVRSAGGILSESEYNMVWWDIGAAAAATSFVVPFYYYASSSYIPLTFTIGTAGTGSGAVRFSTWHGNNTNCNGFGANLADNYCYKPSDVTNMYPALIAASPGGALNDNSYYVVDRFWIIDNTGYATKPDPQIKFTYLNSTNAASEVAAPNQAIDGTLEAQRFNSGVGTWGDYLGQAGTTVVGGTTSTVQTGTSDVTNAGFFRSWTLSGSVNPLPIQLISFTTECSNGYALIKWSTATETNNDHFTIEKTQDGVNYETVAIVKGAGNSSTTLYYSAIDYNPFLGTSYYRILQTDVDGKTTTYGPISFTGCENSNAVSAYSTSTGYINIALNSSSADTYTLMLTDALGQILLTKTVSAAIGLNDVKLYPNVAAGVYILSVRSDKMNYNKKLVLGTIR